MTQKLLKKRSIALFSIFSIIPTTIALITAWLLTIWMPSASFSGTPALFTPAEESLKVALTQTLQNLQSIGPRNDQNPGSLEKTIALLSPTFADVQSYTINEKQYENRIAEIKGSEHPEQIILISAHSTPFREVPAQMMMERGLQRLRNWQNDSVKLNPREHSDLSPLPTKRNHLQAQTLWEAASTQNKPPIARKTFWECSV